MVAVNNMNVDFFRLLYETPLKSSRSGPLYNAFSYPTKISPEAIALFIATHTKPGATVLDAFGGSGTTGLAAMLCDRPTEVMRKTAEDMGIDPHWGPRNACLFEIGTLGSFISKTLCSPPEPDVFSKAVDILCQQARERVGQIYAAKDPSGEIGTIRHVIWSDIVICPHCSRETTYWDATVRYDPLVMSDNFECKGCQKIVKVDDCERAFETVPDMFEGEVVRKKRVVARVYGITGKTKWQRSTIKDDIEIIEEIDTMPLPSSAPNADIVWGDLHRSGYHKGIKKLHHFYTRRNFLVVATMWELASKFPEAVRDALRLVILSYNSSHSTLMTRVVVKKGQKDLVLTGAQSGVLYISGLPVEKNVIEGVARKAKVFKEAFTLVQGSRSRVEVRNESSEQMDLPDDTIDYVFTDPPFGDYIPYAEINQINEIWLRNTTDRTKEIIVSEAQKKGVDKYKKMMGNVFSEMWRVLKPEGTATIVFHSAHSGIWRALTSAYSDAGFSVKATSVLDKIQDSFKQVVSDISVKGDPLLFLVKELNGETVEQPCRVVADEIISGADQNQTAERDPRRLYSRFVARCLEMGLYVDMDAREFYTLINNRAVEMA